jgi:hypothetical protein
MTKAEQLELREEWRKRVATFKASGLSGAAWCASQRLKPHQLYYWQQQLAVDDRSAETPSQWLPVTVTDHQRQEPVGDVLIRAFCNIKVSHYCHVNLSH